MAEDQVIGAGSVLEDLNKLNSTKDRFNYKNDYKIEHLSYPIDLHGANGPGTATFYGNNYVIFYINVSDDSKLLNPTDGGKGLDTVQDWTPQNKTRLIGKDVSAKEAAGASAIEGAVVAGSFDKSKIVKGAGASAIGVAAVASVSGEFTKQLKRLTTAIALHTPNNFSARYNAHYDDVNTAAFQMALKGSETIGQAVTEGVDKANVAESAKNIGAAIALNTIPGKDSISAITGLAPNPKKEQVFKGVDFRTWSFDYQFFPRSLQEYQNVQNIIYLFKLHMHPEYKDADNFLYIYPSEFDIVHYNGSEENLNLPRHTSCVLTELTVNYAPQSQFTSMEGGIPSQINIQITFKELIQMSKERIMEGY